MLSQAENVFENVVAVTDAPSITSSHAGAQVLFSQRGVFVHPSNDPKDGLAGTLTVVIPCAHAGPALSSTVIRVFAVRETVRARARAR